MSPGIAYALWFFLGALGGHRFYTGRSGTAIAMISAFLLGFTGLAIGTDPAYVDSTAAGVWVILTLGGWVVLGITVLIDVFRIGEWVRSHNNTLINKLERDNLRS
jgi:TM2 domain-containing membrane protein YozV